MTRGVGLAAFIAGCLLVGYLGSLATQSSIATWYFHLRKPPLTPPDWIFAPVWSALYVLMALAGWYVWISAAPSKDLLLALFVTQLLLNGVWSFLFFGMRSPLFSLVDIAFLWALVLLFIKIAWRAHQAAAVCFIPYAAWVSFAMYLNAGFYWLNRQGAGA